MDKERLNDASSRITTVVLGAGGFLGMGEKTAGVPFNASTYGVGKDGARIIAIELGHRTADKAAELKDHAARKILDLTKSDRAKQ